ncbi:hypothetical protein LP420_05310 [Massilia sp. B-10]|nr:hypothetical protein LP420_05310 [Massilia sp. B-10]
MSTHPGKLVRRRTARPLARALLAAAILLGGSALALDADRLQARAQAAAAAAPVLRDWSRMLDDNRQQTLDIKLRRVNEFFNHRY